MLLCGALHAQDYQQGDPSFEPIDTFQIRHDTEQIVNDLNRERAKRGMRKLEYIDKYQKTCDQWAMKLARAGTLFHSGYGDGETICLAPLYLSTVIPIFMDSPPHKKILLTRKMKVSVLGLSNHHW